MINFFKKLISKKSTSTKKKLWSFSGGINLPEMKKQSNQTPLLRLPLSNELIIPIQQDTNETTDLIVKVGEYVLKGQALTKSNNEKKITVHATTSGTITAIVPHTATHPSGIKILCAKLKPDNKDQWCKQKPLTNYLQYSTKVLLSRIEQSGIVGLGGAGFPTSIKLKNSDKLINTLIINAAECEPYVTADDKLMQEYAEEIIEGILILVYILQPKEVLIGIENNKPDAIAALKKAILNQKHIIKLRIIPTKYPSGGAKQLVKLLTGKEIPHGTNSSSIGILVQNVSTVFAIKRAIINGEPLIERVVTLTGGAIQHPGNYWVRFGVPVNFLLQEVGIIPKLEQIIIMGGALTGFALSDLNVPIIKTSNCIIAPYFAEKDKHVMIERSCIRCGICAQVCPISLLPQQLYLFSKAQNHDKAKKYHLFDCIECGACAYVCPSNIPLVQYYKKEKALIKYIYQEEQRFYYAKKRVEIKKTRLEREKQLHHWQYSKTTINTEVVTKLKNTTDIYKSAVAASIARAVAKKHNIQNKID